MLEEKRQKIRLIQQRKTQVTDFKDLPQEIPVTLSTFKILLIFLYHNIYTLCFISHF
jgi:hypothetical protein